MSIHLTLAKKLLAHAKDLLKHIFNENGFDPKAAEKELLAAVKKEVDSQLSAMEGKVTNKLQNELQHWQKAPKAETATSVNAPVDMSFDEQKDKDAEADVSDPEDAYTGESEDTTSGDPSSVGNEPNAPDEASKAKDESSPVDDAAAPEGDEPGDKPEESQSSDKADLEAAQQSALDAAPARTAPMPVKAPEGQSAAEFHGDAFPSSALESQAAAEKTNSGETATGEQGAMNESLREQDLADKAALQDTPPDEIVPHAELDQTGEPSDVADARVEEQQQTPFAKGELDAQENMGEPVSQDEAKQSDEKTEDAPESEADDEAAQLPSAEPTGDAEPMEPHSVEDESKEDELTDSSNPPLDEGPAAKE